MSHPPAARSGRHGGQHDLCSLRFLTQLPWMLLRQQDPAIDATASSSAATSTTADPASASASPVAHGATASPPAGGVAAAAGGAQGHLEGRLACPCCRAKLGKYALAGAEEGITCSCGVQVCMVRMRWGGRWGGAGRVVGDERQAG